MDKNDIVEFVEAVGKLADTTHFMGIPIEDFPKLAEKIKAAEAQNAKLKAALEHIHTITIQKTVIDTVYEICDEALAECEGNGE